MDMDDCLEKRFKFELFSTYLYWQLTLNENDMDFRTSVQFPTCPCNEQFTEMKATISKRTRNKLIAKNFRIHYSMTQRKHLTAQEIVFNCNNIPQISKKMYNSLNLF